VPSFNFSAHLLDASRDSKSVLWSECVEGLKNHQVESALQNLGLFGHFRPLHIPKVSFVPLECPQENLDTSLWLCLDDEKYFAELCALDASIAPICLLYSIESMCTPGLQSWAVSVFDLERSFSIVDTGRAELRLSTACSVLTWDAGNSTIKSPNDGIATIGGTGPAPHPRRPSSCLR